MMKRCLLPLVMTFLLTSMGTADDTFWADFTNVIVGDWTGHGAISAEVEGSPLQRGDKFTLRGSYRPTAGGKAILGTQDLIPVDRPDEVYDCTVVFGWEPVGKTIDVRAYWADGAVERMSLRRRQGTDFRGRYTILLPNGEHESAGIALRTSGPDQFAWTFTTGRDAGKTLSTWRRIQSAEPEEYLAFWKDYFQGQWDVTVVQGEDSGVNKTGTKEIFSSQPHPTGTSMVLSSAASDRDVYSAIAGYDPESRAWKEVFFLANGDHLIQWYRASSDELDPNAVGQVLKGQAKYIQADGRTELSDIGVKVISRDKCEYFVKNRRTDGATTPDLLLVFERKKD
jgi:hypothetical protein